MPPRMITRILCISCCVIVSYAFPSNDEKDTASHLKKIGYREELADQEALDIRDHEAVSAAIKDPQEISGLLQTDELSNETIANLKVPLGVAQNETGHSVRNKRSHGEADDDDDDVDDDDDDSLDHYGDVPSLCKNASMDTVALTEDGSTYIFKGDHYWKVHNHAIARGYPKNISDDWAGLPGNLDASVTVNGRRTYFFKGSQYWRFVNKIMDRGYPKLISMRFPGIPDNVDAALSWRGSSRIYFFKGIFINEMFLNHLEVNDRFTESGTKYWHYSFRNEPPVAVDYPKPISEKWSSLFGDGIDAAFQWHNRRVYFFKGRQYYRYNVRTYQIDQVNPPYPHPTSTDWLGC